jgi:hypothetical protein
MSGAVYSLPQKAISTDISAVDDPAQLVAIRHPAPDADAKKGN